MSPKETIFSRRLLVVPAAIAALMLLGALGSGPYAYYTLLPWVTCSAAVIFALSGYSSGKVWAAWVFGFIAILFNPIAPVYLSRQVWQPIDIGAAILFAVGAAVLTSVPSRSRGGTSSGV